MLWVALTLAALVGWDMFPTQGLTLFHAYLLATAGLALWVLVHALTAAYPRWGRTSFDALFVATPAKTPAPPEELEVIRRTISFSEFSAHDVHTRLKPLLREIADAHLAARYGRGLEADSAQVRAWLGPQVWEFLRPSDLPDRDAPGMNRRDIDSLVAALEELAGS
jgi:hypothetical protein